MGSRTFATTYLVERLGGAQVLDQVCVFLRGSHQSVSAPAMIFTRCSEQHLASVLQFASDDALGVAERTLCVIVKAQLRHT
jgi:hypothetical protein